LRDGIMASKKFNVKCIAIKSHIKLSGIITAKILIRKVDSARR